MSSPKTNLKVLHVVFDIFRPVFEKEGSKFKCASVFPKTAMFCIALVLCHRVEMPPYIRHLFKYLCTDLHHTKLS